MALNIAKIHKSYEVVKKVILTPKREGARYDVEYTRERVYTYDGYEDGESRLVFNPDEWDMAVETGKSEKFEKVAAVVGSEKAYEVLEALGL